MISAELYEQWLRNDMSDLTPEDRTLAARVFMSGGITVDFPVCRNCGDLLPNGASFCISCGDPKAGTQRADETIRLAALPATGRTMPL